MQTLRLSLFAGIAAAACPLACAAQDGPAYKHLEGSVDFNGIRVQELVAQLAKHAGVSAGIVTTEGCGSLPRVDFNLVGGATLDEMLFKLKDSLPRAEWSARGDVLGFTVIGAAGTGRLDRAVRGFEWNASESAAVVAERLLVESGLEKALSLEGFERATHFGGISFVPRSPAQTGQAPAPTGARQVSSGQMAQVLDAVVSAHPGTSWSYEEIVCGRKKIYDLMIY